MLETHDIQGLVFSGYANHPSAAYLFFSIPDTGKAKEWLRQMVPLVTTGGRDGKFARDRDFSLNVAFTCEGIGKLGLGEATLTTFSRPFVEGMSEENRARILNDTPKQWTWGRPGHHIHVLLMLFAGNESALQELAKTETGRANRLGGLQELLAIRSKDLPGDRENFEHFGFRDGIAQPDIAEYRPQKHKPGGPGNLIKAGEFILGYENEYGQKTDSPTLQSPDSDFHGDLIEGDLGRNGTYLVLRQLAQDVPGFWNMLREQCRRAKGASQGETEEDLGAKLVGRRVDGTPLALEPLPAGLGKNVTNDFGYSQDDPYGYRCPLGAHIRRANPRDALLEKSEDSLQTVKKHRLLRRGRPYGSSLKDRYTDDGKERGLVFITLNANIERQFEFVQHAWITSPNFAGLYDEADPILGGRTRESGLFTIPKQPVRERRHGIFSHVTVKGGAYFFLPSVRALSCLSR